MFLFGDNVEVDNLDVVPENFRVFYQKKEDDGSTGHKLRDDAGTKAAVACITGLNSSLKAARTEAAGFKGKAVDLTALGEYGTDPESILKGFKTKLDEVKAANKNTSDQDVERKLEKIKADLSKTHSQQVKDKEVRIDALKKQLHGHLVDAAAVIALKDSIDPDLALPFVQRAVRVEEVDGKFLVNVVDSAGDVRYSGTTGTRMSIQELVDEMKGQSKYKPLFKSTAPTGGGTTPGATNRGTPSQKPGELSATDKISAGLKAGLATQPA